MTQPRPDPRNAPVQLPLKLGLNDGTYMPAACVKVLRHHASPVGLRHYASADNTQLRQAIAATDGVTPDHLFVHNGSGPILRQVTEHVIRASIKASPLRVMRHYRRSVAQTCQNVLT